MKAKLHVKQTGEKMGRLGQGSENTRGGSYGDAKAATSMTKRKTKDKPSEKKKGGGYGDARGATEKKREGGIESKGTENIRKPF